MRNRVVKDLGMLYNRLYICVCVYMFREREREKEGRAKSPGRAVNGQRSVGGTTNFL